MEFPIKGKDVVATLSDGSDAYVFRCACANSNCKEWRCSVTGSGLMIDVIKWKYVDKNS